MMKTRVLIATIAISFAAASACFAANPQMGTWKLNEAKSKMPAGMGKNTTVVYAQEGNKVRVTVEGVDQAGKPTHSVWVGQFDGKAYPARGNVSWDSAAYRMINDHTNNITTWKNGKIVWSGKITVAPDGKSRTVTINGTDAAGKKFTGTAVYDKG